MNRISLLYLVLREILNSISGGYQVLRSLAGISGSGTPRGSAGLDDVGMFLSVAHFTGSRL